MTNRPLSRRSLLSLLSFGGALAPFAFAPAPARADQPRMQAALDALHLAERELVAATPDKGGHRGNALSHVRAAIKQVEAGIRFDRRH